MFATITRVARRRAFNAVDAPNELAWRTLGAAWAIWACGWVLGMNAWYWGSLLVVSALWITTSAVDRLRAFDAMSPTTAALLRSFLLGMALICTPQVILAPGAGLGGWAAIVVAGVAAHLLAPWALSNTGRHELWRWWNDIKAAAAVGGAVVGSVLVAIAVAGASFETSQHLIFGALTGCAFCIMPTVLTLRAARS